ncbi:hypothetical protein [Streptomyces sp. NPDC002133]|uniref:DUF7927 domain-containing protein n=1 Tax=Streptomyces sp. NPDC002133 TaxID=3154409 RepID=UPI003332E1AE
MGYTRLMGAWRQNSRTPRLLGALTVLTTVSAAVSTGMLAPDGAAAAPAAPPFETRYDASLYGDFTTIGSTAEHGGGTGRVGIPEGARVAYARLFWGGHDGTYRAPDGGLLRRCAPSAGAPLAATPSIRVNRNEPVTVHATNLVQDAQSAPGEHYYTGEADVTAAFNDVTGSGTPLPVAVDGIWTPAGPGCTAGWSLTVVYAYDGPDEAHAPVRRTVRIYGGHALQRPAAPAATVPVSGVHRSRGQVRASVTAYGGDGKSTDGGFLVKEVAVPAASATFSLGTVGGTADTHLASAVALSAPALDVEITKTASTTTAEPGDMVTYTITAKNLGDTDLTDVRFTDDLTDNLDDAVYDGDAAATTGKVSYAEPELSYAGDIPAGQSVTVTYSVTVGPAGTGDGSLRNSVVEESEWSNCEAASDDAKCTVTPVIVHAAGQEEPQAAADPAEEAADDSIGTPVIGTDDDVSDDLGDDSSGSGEEGAEQEDPAPADAGGLPDEELRAPRAAGSAEATGSPEAPGNPVSAGTAVDTRTGPAAVGSAADTAGPDTGAAIHGSLPEMAATGVAVERLWLLGGVAVSLTGAGAIALVATRERRRNH